MPSSCGMVTSRPWMASRMAVSAETNATVIKTRAKSNMRKNCRIAKDYNFPVETRLCASPPRRGVRLQAETGQARLYEDFHSLPHALQVQPCICSMKATSSDWQRGHLGCSKFP